MITALLPVPVAIVEPVPVPCDVAPLCVDPLCVDPLL
jgi:hypothetical protein